MTKPAKKLSKPGSTLFASGNLTPEEERFFDYKNVVKWLMPSASGIGVQLSMIPDPYQSILAFYLPQVTNGFIGKLDIMKFAILISDWVMANMPSFPGVLTDVHLAAIDALPRQDEEPVESPFSMGDDDMPMAPKKRRGKAKVDKIDTSAERFKHLEID